MKFPKHQYIRSQTLLRNARELPCQHCGADDGTVVAAHTNWQGGKGKGIKADDNLIASLCHHCHMELDQGGKLDKAQRQKIWLAAHRETVRKLQALKNMPTMPSNQKCSELGCKNPRSRLNTYCINHGGMDNMATRETDSAYQTPLWKTIRMAQLSKQPLCQGCLARGIVAAAKHIDHLFAWKHIGSHAFSRNIFQSLCHNCHSQKSGLEKQGIYRHYAQEGVKDYSKHDYAFMLHQYNTSSETRA